MPNFIATHSIGRPTTIPATRLLLLRRQPPTTGGRRRSRQPRVARVMKWRQVNGDEASSRTGFSSAASPRTRLSTGIPRLFRPTCSAPDRAGTSRQRRDIADYVVAVKADFHRLWMTDVIDSVVPWNCVRVCIRARVAFSAAYEPRNPEASPLYQVVAGHLETFLARQRQHERHVPAFVEREFRSFLDCGLLCRGFLRVHCQDCGLDRLVAFSCKGRAFCQLRRTEDVGYSRPSGRPRVSPSLLRERISRWPAGGP